MSFVSDPELETAVATLYSTPAIQGPLVVPRRQAVAFIANVDETYQAYLWHIDTGEYVPLTRAADPVAQCVPSSDGRHVAVLRDTDGNELFRLSVIHLDEVEAGERLVTPEPVGRVRIVGWHPNGGSVVLAGNDDIDSFVSTLNLATGANQKLLTTSRWIEATDLSDDGGLIAASISRNEADPEDYDIAVVTVAGGDVAWLSTGEGHRDGSPLWSPDGQRLAITSEIDDETWFMVFEWPDATEVARVRVDGDEIALSYWSPDRTSVVFVSSHEGVRRLWQASIASDEIIIAPREEPGSAHYVDRDADRVVVVTSAINRPQTRLELRDLDHHLLALLEIGNLDLPLGAAESVWFDSRDGTHIQGWLVRDPAAEPGAAVVYVHGGPTWATFDSWHNDIQSLVLAGFTVLTPNYRGSTSFGPAFRKANVGDLGGGDLDDCLAAAEWLKAQPGVDSARVAITGGSYGGYMTLWALVKAPDAFVCGAGLVPVTDWVADYELADAAFRYFDVYFFGGTPEENPDLYRDRSPLTLIDDLQAPLFVGAGRNDSRCPFAPIEKFVERGWELGKDMEFDIQEAEGHGAARKTAAIDTQLKVLRFLRERCGIT